MPWSLQPPVWLGRGVVVAPAGPVPPAWADAPRVRIGPKQIEQPASVIGLLRELVHRCRGPVIEIHPAAAIVLARDRPPPSPPGVAVWQVPLEAPADLAQLHHAVWSNAIDLRQPGFGWWALEAAVRLGARLPTAHEERSGPPRGDVCTPTGRWCWIDGGPFRIHPDSALSVLPAVTLEHGSLTPPDHVPAAAELSAVQRAAVEEPTGSVRVIAAAGSGKTRVLTERARHLLTAWHVPPTAVTMVAFNRRARDEMVQRTTDLAGIQVRTLNSLALAIVNGVPPFAPQPRVLRTLSDSAARQLLARSIGGPERGPEVIEAHREAFGRIRLGLRSPEQVAEQFEGQLPHLAATWVAYRAALQRADHLDFDGQVHGALEILLGHQDARRAAQRCCRLMLVDEFQDLSPAHLLLLQLLTAAGGSIFGVGDDDQTIYGYAGATPNWLVDYERYVPGAVTHRLAVNHRCPAAIVTAVTALLGQNRLRVPKEIEAHSAAVDGSLVIDRSPEPVAATVRAVTAVLAGGDSPSSVVVLARVNALLVPVHTALVRFQHVPVSCSASAEFSRHPVIAAYVAWYRAAAGPAGGRFATRHLRLIIGASPPAPLRRWLSRLPAAVGVRDLLHGVRELDSASAAIVRDRIDRIAVLRELIVSGRPAGDLVATSVGSVGVRDAHARSASADLSPGDSLPVNDHLTALQQMAELWPRHDELMAELASLAKLPDTVGGVLLSTIHRVKGQEWPHVVVHQADATQLPHRLSDDVEEERRLLHVAITRASRRAVVVTGANPSPFIAELGVSPDPHHTAR